MSWQRIASREGVDLTTISGIDLVFYDHLWEFLGKKEELFFTVLSDRNFTHYIGTNHQEFGRYVYKKFFKNVEMVKKYYEEGEVFLKEIEESIKKIESSDLYSSFAVFRKQFMKINYVYSITSWLAIEAWQNDFERILSSLIAKGELQEKEDVILDVVYAPWKKTALHAIQDRIKEGVPVSTLVSDFQFLRSWSVVWYKSLDKDWFENIGKYTDVDEKLSRKEVLELLNPNAKEKAFLDLAPYILFFKDWRDDLRRKQIYLWNPLFEKIAEQFGIAYDDLGYLTLDEIEKALFDGFDENIIIERKKNPCIVTITGDALEITVCKGIPKKYASIIAAIEDKEKSLLIKGLSAFKGVVRGKVVLVRSYHDLKKVCAGDVLVANTTHPTYLPAMHRAAAFVTNEGGVVSHAAIVAREMKKPCIVGTKVATKILLDGDYVEVDAENGVVKKL
jgi:phosphohistidine swiveling domain-containing protein